MEFAPFLVCIRAWKWRRTTLRTRLRVRVLALHCIHCVGVALFTFCRPLSFSGGSITFIRHMAPSTQRSAVNTISLGLVPPSSPHDTARQQLGLPRVHRPQNVRSHSERPTSDISASQLVKPRMMPPVPCGSGICGDGLGTDIPSSWLHRSNGQGERHSGHWTITSSRKGPKVKGHEARNV